MCGQSHYIAQANIKLAIKRISSSKLPGLHSEILSPHIMTGSVVKEATHDAKSG